MNLPIQFLDADVQGYEAIAAIQSYGCANERPVNIDNVRLQHGISPAQPWSPMVVTTLTA